jgi:hypothetical protein
MLADSRRAQGRPPAISRTGARHGAFRLIRKDARRYHRARMDLLPYDLPTLEGRVRDALAEDRACNDDDVARTGASA